MSKQQTVKYSIRQDGVVSVETSGVTGSQYDTYITTIIHLLIENIFIYNFCNIVLLNL